MKRVSVLDNHSNHSPSPEIDTRHPFKMLNPSDWEGMERFSRRLYLLQQGSSLEGKTQPLSWHQTANVLIMEYFFTEKTFEDFGDVAALMSLYETVHQDVEVLFRSIPELVNGRDCVVNLIKHKKASKPSSAIRHHQHLKHRSATPSSIELAQLGPSEVATRGGLCENDAIYQAIKHRICFQTYLSHLIS